MTATLLSPGRPHGTAGMIHTHASDRLEKVAMNAKDHMVFGAAGLNVVRDRDARLKRAQLTALKQRWSTLTPREREVLALVVSGLLNKQSAAELGISEVTLQIHRGKVMRKMQAGSLAELVRMSVTLGIAVTHSHHAGP